MNTSAVLTPEWVTQPRRALDLSHRLTNKLWWHPVVLLDSPAPHALSWMTLNPSGPLMALFVKATVARFPRITSLRMYSRVKIEADLESEPTETECFFCFFGGGGVVFLPDAHRQRHAPKSRSVNRIIKRIIRILIFSSLRRWAERSSPGLCYFFVNAWRC